MSSMTPTEMARTIGGGLLSFPVTHFNADLCRSTSQRYRQHCAWLLQHPVAGLFAAGGTGEFFWLTPAESATWLRSAAKKPRSGASDRGGGLRKGEAVELDGARRAGQGGRHPAAFAVPDRAPQEGLAAYVGAVCQAT